MKSNLPPVSPDVVDALQPPPIDRESFKLGLLVGLLSVAEGFGLVSTGLIQRTAKAAEQDVARIFDTEEGRKDLAAVRTVLEL